MGCDIHVIAQVRDLKTGEWISVLTPIFSDYSYSSQSVQPNQDMSPYSRRNYILFSILAGVRNYNGVDPIKYPAGDPDDADPIEIEFLYNGFLSGEHSRSYLTLKEICDYNWDTTVDSDTVYLTYDQYINEYKKLSSKDDKYDYLLKYRSQQARLDSIEDEENYELLDQRDMEKLIKKGVSEEKLKAKWVGMLFRTRAKDCTGLFYNYTIPELKSLVPDGGNYDDVRIIFDFDS